MMKTIFTVAIYFLSLYLVSAQTELAADINGGPGSSSPQEIVDLNGKLYFSAATAATGRELFFYDPVTKQATLVADLRPGNGSSSPVDLTVLNGKIYFLAAEVEGFNYLYEYDPTTHTATAIHNFTQNDINSNNRPTSQIPKELLVMNNELYLIFYKWFGKPDHQATVIKYNPVTASFTEAGYIWGTDEVSLQPYSLHSITSLNGVLYMNGLPAEGDQFVQHYIYRLDPASGEGLISTGESSYLGAELVPFNNKIYFSYFESPGIAEFDPSMNLLDFITPENFRFDFYAQYITVLGNKLYFQAGYQNTGAELYALDPSTRIFNLVADIAPNESSNPNTIRALNNKLYFRANTPSSGTEPYIFDPETNQVDVIDDIEPGAGSSNPTGFASVNNLLYFSAFNSASGAGIELWKEEEIANVRLVSAIDGEVISMLTDSITVTKAIFPVTGVNIIADLSASHKSIFYALTGPLSTTQTQNEEPFAIFGQNNGILNRVNLPNGNYTLEATPFTGQNKTGTPGDTKSIAFSIITDVHASNIRMVDAITGSFITDMQDTLVINKATFQGLHVNILADVTSSQYNSLFFELTGPVSISKMQNDAPFALFGDNNGELYGKNLPEGDYSLSVTPYLRKNNTGYMGEKLTVFFTIINDLKVSNIRIVDALNSEELVQMNDSTIVDKATFPVTGVNILADVSSPELNSLFFELSGPLSVSKLQNEAPFALFGDDNGRLFQQSLPEGDYTLTVTPYSQKDQRGAIGTVSVLSFSVIDDLKVTNIRLVRSSGVAIDSIEDGMLIRLPTSEPVNILVNVPNPEFNSVHFDLQGPQSITKNQNTIPYAVFGNSNSILNTVVLPAGDYTLTSTVYRRRDQTGKAGTPVVLNFSIEYDDARLSNSSNGQTREIKTDGQASELSEIALAVYPNPLGSELLNIEFESREERDLPLIVSDLLGKTVYEKSMLVTKGSNQLQLDLSHVPQGTYILSFFGNGKTNKKKVIKQP